MLVLLMVVLNVNNSLTLTARTPRILRDHEYGMLVRRKEPRGPLNVLDTEGGSAKRNTHTM